MFNVFYYVFINHFCILKAIQNSLNIPSFVFFILYKNALHIDFVFSYTFRFLVQKMLKITEYLLTVEDQVA